MAARRDGGSVDVSDAAYSRPDRGSRRVAQLATPLRRGLRLLVRPQSIRAKLIRILAFSLALVLALLGVLISGQVAAFSQAEQSSRTVSVALAVQEVVHQLQLERGLTNGMLSGASGFAAQLGPRRAQTDAALAALNQTIDNAANADAGAAAVRTALASLARLASVRQVVDSGQAQTSPTFEAYTDDITALNQLNLGLDQAQDDTLRHALQALYALGDVKEYLGQEGGLLAGVFASPTFNTDDYTDFSTILGEKQAALADYQYYATQPEYNELSGVLSSTAATEFAEDEGIAVAGVQGRLPDSVNPVSWLTATNEVMNGLRTVQQSVGADITARADALASAATRWLILIGALAALVIAAMVALVIGAARSVIGPLSMLAREADEVSLRRLPAAVAALQTATEVDQVPRPVPVTAPAGSASEITLVADALDRVQNAALTLASQQAMIRRNTTFSLANLGRRNQNLVRRQLGLISEFEQDELDPAALANMFELDHLATRMRRNAESLLVLVGENSPRPSAQPLPVADVIRAALSEVEDYRRVVLRRVDDVLIAGSVVTEVAHMLAELVENGLAFSPPDLEVEIYGRLVGGRYLLVVLDYGVGMSKEDLARARSRLRDEENFLVAPTRFLGHYVVGRLAKQLAITVDLGESPVTGITARLVLPAEVVSKQPANYAVPQERPVRRPTRRRPLATVTSPAETTAARTASGSGSVAGLSGVASTNGAAGPNGATGPARPGTNGHAVAVSAAGPPQRTRNGLVKRQPKGGAAVPVRPAVTVRPPEPRSASDRSASERGSMLAAFSRGHQRGEHAARGSGDQGAADRSAQHRAEEGRGDR